MNTILETIGGIGGGQFERYVGMSGGPLTSGSIASSVSMRATAERVAAYWRDKDVPGAPGATAAAVRAFQERHGVALPADLGTLYSIVNGNECDRHMFRLWPLSELERISVTVPVIMEGELEAPEEYFAFADWMLESHLFAVRLRPDIPCSGPVVWVMDSRHGVVAASFEDFWERYLADPEGTTSLTGQPPI